MSNETYKGTIELISGLVQKNNQDFPLMEASAVAFYEEDAEGNIREIRLPEKLQSVGISEQDKQDLIQNAVTATISSESYTALSGNVTKNAENIATLDSELDALALKVEQEAGDNKDLIVHYDVTAQKLYLYEKDENGEIDFDPGTGTVIKVNQLSETTIQGGGGSSSGAAATYSLSFVVDKNTKDSFSVLEGRPAELAYTVALSEKRVDTTTGETTYEPITGEKITYSIYKDNVYQRAVTEETVKSGSIDVTDLLTLGTNNFKITASVIEYIDRVNEDGETETVAVPTRASARWTVNVVNMKLEVPDAIWEATPKYAATSFVYTPIGALSKTIHFILDGTEIHTETTSLNGTSMTYTIPMQSHGVHTLEVYCEGTIEEETISTDRYKYVLMFIDSKNTTTPIIRIKADNKGQQYSNTRIYFNVYDPMDETADQVEIFENDVLKNTYTNITSSEQFWDYKPQEAGMKTIKIKYFSTEASVDIDVAEFPYKITPTLGDLMVDFVPTGRTNQDIDYNVFKNNAYTVVTDEESGETTTEEIPMTWTFSDNFDWINGGWKVDENGDSYFCVKAGTSVDINYNLFNKEDTIAKKDANGNYSIAGTGKEFKLIFKTSNVARSDATWLSCIANADNDQPTGIQMDVHNAYVKSNFDTLEIPYSEEDIIEFDMNIVPITQFSATYEPEFTSKVIPMIMTYEDGTPVQPKVITNPATSFKQTSAVPITIGSEYCDVYIYRLKVYERYLTESEILNNFIADSRSGDEMSSRYLRNQIYYAGQSSFGGKEQDLIALAEACPDLRIYLVSAPYFTNNKSDKVGNTTIKQWYFKNGKDSLYDNWVAEGCTHNGQGTSSNEYGYSGRNLEFNMKKTEFTLADNLTKVSKVPLTPTSVPTNYFNFKINIASSENANNALLQKRFDRYLPYTSLASEKDDRVKNTMEFYNCVVFIQETNEDLSTHREFNDTDIHFYGIGNIGDSKKTDSTRVNDKEDPNEFCVEIMDWNRYLSSFPADTMINAMSFSVDPETEEKIYVWAKDENLDILYELIDGEYVLTSDSTVNYNKVYYVDILEHDDFSEDFNYGWRYIQTEYEKGDEVDGVEITEEQADALNKEFQAPLKQKWIEFYRFITRDLTTNGVEDSEKVAAWKAEFQDWFILDAALYYYLFTLRYTMVDNRAKNSFWHYGKCSDGKYRFDFWDYDNDTALGIDNAGKLEIPFGVEDADTDPEGAPYFRAHDSVFFTRVAKYFTSELNAMWTRIEQNTELGNAFDSTNFINEFDNWQAQFPEELWRLDYERKYKRTYVGGEGKDWDNALPKIVEGAKVVEKRYLTEMMNGRKKYQRRQFERNQDFYMSSKFFGSKNYSNSITLRGSGNSTSHTIPADFTLTVTPFNNMYLNMHDGTNNFYHRRVYAGQEYPINLLDSISNLDLLYIRGASNLQSLGDLSLMYLQTATLGAGAKLKNIILGNKATGYSNGALKTLEIGASNKLLEELDIRNLSNLSSTDLPVTGIPSLKRVYAQGSNISTARFANNGLLEEAYLPATITQLQLRNLYFLHTLEVESYANLTDLTVENCANVDTLSIINQAPKLNTLRVTDIEWTFETTDTLNRLYSINSTITGYVHVDAIRRSELDAYAEKWPELEVHYSRIIQQWNLNFYNEDADISTDLPVYSYKVDTNTTLYPNLYDPAQNGMLSEDELPKKADSEDGKYTYTFKDWNPSMEPNLNDQGEEEYLTATSDMNFFATFESKLKTYTITWYGYNRVVVDQQEVPYGGDAVFAGELPTRTNLADAYYLFGGWDSSTSNVTRDKDIFPIWLEANPGAPTTSDSAKMSAVEVYSLAQYTKDQNYNYAEYNKYFGTDKEITVQMGYMPEFENVESRIFTEAMKTYTGIKSDVVVTNETLFNPNQSFTLAIDFTPGYQDSAVSTKKDNTIVGCMDTEFKGFRLYSPNYTPILQWHGADEKNIYPTNSNVTTSTKTFREICVIRYEAGSKTLYLYSNNRFSLDDVYEQELTVSTNWADFNAPLTFGGHVYENGNYTNYATGTIHYAKLWRDDLGAEECKKICYWTYQTLAFEQVDTGRYNYMSEVDGVSKSLSTTASFVATELLEQPIKFYPNRIEGNLYPGWQGSQIRTWLNKKVIAGFAPEWQQIIQPTVVYSLGNQDAPSTITKVETENEVLNYYNRTSTTDRIYIPAYTEVYPEPPVANTTSYAKLYAKYGDDKGPNKNSLTSYRQYTAESNSSRIKKYQGTDTAGLWWTRTPNLTSPSYVYAVTPDGNSANGMFYPDPVAGNIWFHPHAANAGALISFSI